MKEVDLRKILEALGIQPITLTSAGWLVCSCPFASETHAAGEDRSPSFTVKVENEGLSAYNCFSCKEHGNVQKLVKKLGFMRGRDYSKLYADVVMAELPGRFSDFDAVPDSVTPAREINETAIIGMFPLAWEHKAAREYLKSRGIKQATSKRAGLLYDDEQCRILFPVRAEAGALNGFSSRSILSDAAIEYRSRTERLYRKIKDYAGLEKSKCLLGAHMVREGRKKFVVEGLFAWLHLLDEGVYEEGLDILATLGSNLSNMQRDMLVDWDCPVILCYDDDLAGDEGLFGTRNKEGKHRGGGAVDKLKKHVATYLFTYADGRNEVDDLTKAEIMSGVKKHLELC